MGYLSKQLHKVIDVGGVQVLSNVSLLLEVVLGLVGGVDL